MISPFRCSLVFLALGGALCVRGAAPAAPAPTSGLPAATIPVGTVYDVFAEEFPTDADYQRQVDVDVAAMAAAHLTDVMIFPMSQWDPATKTLRWDRTDYLVKKIEEAHLHFVPLVLKQEQCSHWFPIWKFKELGLWNERNRDNGNPNNRENVDFADPQIFPLAKDYVRAVVERYRSSPALRFYNLWNEPHYSETAPHVVDAFRQWLQRKYGSLAALRRAWGDDYTDWDQVSPFLNDNWDSEMPGVDWAQFRLEYQGELLSELGAVVRAADPTHAINVNPVGSPIATLAPYGGYNNDPWQFPAYEDFGGASYYPDAWAKDQGLTRAPRWFHDLSFTSFRCAAGDKGFVLTELYTNAKSGFTLGGYLDAGTARTLAWTALANDCKGILYWKWQPFMRGRQSLGRGLVRLDGQLAPRGEVVKAFAEVVQANGPLLRDAHPVPAEVGIVVDLVGQLRVQVETAEPSMQSFMNRSIAGVFHALDDANIPADLLRVDRGLSLARLRRYRVLFLPFQIVMRREFAAVLRQYVEAGGTLVADARTATMDELDFAYAHNPGAGLVDVFGAERLDWVASPRPVTIHGAVAEVWSGDASAAPYRESLRVAPGDRVLATFDDGAPAMVEHQLGAGRAVLAAVPLGASYQDASNGGMDRVIRALATLGGAQPTASFAADAGADAATVPLIRVHARGGERVVYVINDGATPIHGRVSIAAPAGANARATDLVSGQVVTGAEAAGRLTLPVSLPPDGVAVLHLP